MKKLVKSNWNQLSSRNFVIFFRCTSPTDQQYDQKNIRRRVYDALNVLMAMNIISKEKKEIRWLGLPTNSIQEANGLELDKAKRIDRIKAKTQQLQDLILQVNYIPTTYLYICLLNENLCIQNVLAKKSFFIFVWECRRIQFWNSAMQYFFTDIQPNTGSKFGNIWWFYHSLKRNRGYPLATKIQCCKIFFFF